MPETVRDLKRPSVPSFRRHAAEWESHSAHNSYLMPTTDVAYSVEPKTMEESNQFETLPGSKTSF